MRKLIVTGSREIITHPDVVEKISRILGKAWRVAEPEVEGEETTIRLFWWETMEHYTKWRSDWDTYLAWLIPQVDPEEGVKKFDERFRDENTCLQLLKSGKIQEARQRFPKLVDQILKIA